MSIEHQVGRLADARAALLANPVAGFAHPDDVVESRVLTLVEKREILAAWASDANAVPDRPWLRQLESGIQVPVREIVEALKTLDSTERASRDQRTRNRWKSSDDDDDPPPCPVSARPPPGSGPGGLPLQDAGELALA